MKSMFFRQTETNREESTESSECGTRPVSVSICVGWLVVFNVPSTARSFRDVKPAFHCPIFLILRYGS